MRRTLVQQYNIDSNYGFYNQKYIYGWENSILQNLPIPNISMLEGNSNILIRQCILQFFGSGKLPKKVLQTHPD